MPKRLAAPVAPGAAARAVPAAMPFFRDLSKPQPLEFHAEMLLGVQRPHNGSLQRRHTMKE